MKLCYWVPIVALALMGCAKSVVQVPAEETMLSLFQEGKGVVLPDDMQKLFSLELADVSEANLPMELEKTAQVYRVSGGSSPALATARLTEAETQLVKSNQAVQIKADGLNVSGSVVTLDRVSESASGQTEVLLQFADPQKKAAAGDFVEAKFVLTKEQSAVVVPSSALLSAAEGTFVYAVNGKHFLRTKVATGAATSNAVEIVDGLYAGDIVVSKGVNDLWLIELQATKTGKACCEVPKK